MIRSMQLALALLGVVCLVTFVGCPAGDSGPATVPVKGTLTIDGQPAKDVIITFSPVDPKMPPASGPVTNGAFELRTGTQGKLGAVVGKYKVTLAQQVAAADAGAGYKSAKGAPPKVEKSFPDKYASPTTSDKEVEVTAGANDIKIEIAK